jgi:hypothetical protein
MSAVSNSDTYTTLRFSGSGSDPMILTWGQRSIWDVIGLVAPQDHHLNGGWVDQVPAVVNLPTLLKALESLLVKHESLRTAYWVDDSNLLWQRVVAEGQLPILLREAGSLAPLSMAQEMYRDFKNNSYDRTSGDLMRIGIITQDTQPAFLVVCLSHMITDVGGARVLRADLRDFIESPEKSTDPVWQPRNQVEIELSPAGQRRGKRSLKYLRSQLEDFPSSMFAWPRKLEKQPRHWCGELTSPSLAPAVSELCRRHAITATSAIFAAFSATIGVWAHRDSCCMSVAYSNRDRRNTNSVGNYTQNVPVRIDLTGESFHSLLRETHRILLNSYRFAAYPPAERIALTEEINRARGTLITEDCLFNSHWFTPTEPSGTETYLNRRQGASEPSTFRWREGIERGGAIMYIEARYPETLTLLADTRYIAPDEFESILRAVERLLIEGVGRDYDPLGLLSDSGIDEVPRDR